MKSIEEATKAYHSYPGYEEKIKKFGLIAFKLKVVSRCGGTAKEIVVR